MAAPTVHEPSVVLTHRDSRVSEISAPQPARHRSEGLALWLVDRLRLSAPLLNSEYQLYASWARQQEFEPVSAGAWWRVVVELLGDTLVVRKGNELQRLHDVSSVAPKEAP